MSKQADRPSDVRPIVIKPPHPDSGGRRATTEIVIKPQHPKSSSETQAGTLDVVKPPKPPVI